MSKFTVAADGAATPVATQPTLSQNMTTGVFDAIAGSTTVAYGGNALRTIGITLMGAGAVIGNYIGHRAWKSATERGQEPKRYLGMFTV